MIVSAVAQYVERDDNAPRLLHADAIIENAIGRPAIHRAATIDARIDFDVRRPRR